MKSEIQISVINVVEARKEPNTKDGITVKEIALCTLAIPALFVTGEKKHFTFGIFERCIALMRNNYIVPVKLKKSSNALTQEVKYFVDFPEVKITLPNGAPKWEPIFRPTTKEARRVVEIVIGSAVREQLGFKLMQRIVKAA